MKGRAPVFTLITNTRNNQYIQQFDNFIDAQRQMRLNNQIARIVDINGNTVDTHTPMIFDPLRGMRLAR